MWILAVVGACRIGFDETVGVSDAPISGDASDASRGDASVADASLVPCVSTTCNAAGGSCVDGTCEIANNGEVAIACPAGMPCRVLCLAGSRPCRDGVSCAGATSCEVHCIGFRACQYGVDCADSTCAVTCNGDEACETGIMVGPGGTCTSHCCGVDACLGGIGTCAGDAVCN